MKNNSIVFFNSNDKYPVVADTHGSFEQHRDLFYLTGINQEETILVLFKENEKVSKTGCVSNKAKRSSYALGGG